MSTRTYSSKDIQRILKNNGYTFQRQTGSHAIYKNERGEHITIRFRNCNKMVWQRMLKQWNLSVD